MLGLVRGDSNIEFAGSHSSSHLFAGRFATFDAQMAFTRDVPTLLTFNVDLRSIHTGDAALDSYLMSSSFFDATRFPISRFSAFGISPSASSGKYTIEGPLTMHGIDKVVSFPATITTSGAQTRVSGELAFDCRDWRFPAAATQYIVRPDVHLKLDLHFGKK